MKVPHLAPLERVKISAQLSPKKSSLKSLLNPSLLDAQCVLVMSHVIGFETSFEILHFDPEPLQQMYLLTLRISKVSNVTSYYIK